MFEVEELIWSHYLMKQKKKKLQISPTQSSLSFNF